MLLPVLGRVPLEKLDVLLDRLTDRALASPRAGSAASRSDWLDLSTDDGRDLERQSVLTHRARVQSRSHARTSRSLGVTDEELRAGGIDARPRAEASTSAPPLSVVVIHQAVTGA